MGKRGPACQICKMFGPPFELLLGRKTYEIFAAHWPYAGGGEDDFIAKRFNSITKYVATRSTMELTWKGSVALHGDFHAGTVGPAIEMFTAAQRH